MDRPEEIEGVGEPRSKASLEEVRGAPLCIGCNKHPADMEEYRDAAEVEEISPDEFVRTEEGTFNPENGHFLCSDCYVKWGMPSSPRGWIAP